MLCYVMLCYICFRVVCLFLQAGKGMLRSMIGDLNAMADIVPVDYSANMMLAIAWHRVIKR